MQGPFSFHLFSTQKQPMPRPLPPFSRTKISREHRSSRWLPMSHPITHFLFRPGYSGTSFLRTEGRNDPFVNDERQPGSGSDPQ
jgi:hypothetical protein